MVKVWVAAGWLRGLSEDGRSREGEDAGEEDAEGGFHGRGNYSDEIIATELR